MVQDYARSTFPFIRQRDLPLMGMVLGTGCLIEIFTDNWSTLPPRLAGTSPYSHFTGTNSTSIQCPKSLIPKVCCWVLTGHMPQAPSCFWLLNFIKITILMWLFHMSNCCFRDVMQWCLARRFCLVGGDPCFENPLVWVIPVSFIQAYALKHHSHTL